MSKPVVEVKQEPKDPDEEEEEQLVTPPCKATEDGIDELSDGIEQMKLEVKEEKTDDYDKLLEYGLDIKVVNRLDDIYKTGTFRN